MKPQVPGVSYVSERDAGSHWQYRFVLLDDDPAMALRRLLAELSPGHEVQFPEPGPDDCYLEVRKTPRGFETKRGCHGAYGTWSAASVEEAFQWLLPGAREAKDHSGIYGGLDFPKSGSGR